MRKQKRGKVVKILDSGTVSMSKNYWRSQKAVFYVLLCIDIYHNRNENLEI